MRIDISLEMAQDPWFKVVDMLQHNWAVIFEESESVLAVFYGDTCGIFDELRFDTVEEAKSALKRNGFRKYKKDKLAQEVIPLPEGEFRFQAHPNGRIYSSGRFWS